MEVVFPCGARPRVRGLLGVRELKALNGSDAAEVRAVLEKAR